MSLWEHNGRLLLFQSVDTPQTNGRLYCSPVRTSDTTACGPACFEGIRIFDITPATVPQPVSNPYYIKGVYTDCGSHTHTLVPDLDDNRVLLYISSVPGSSGPNCQAPHNKISIVEVPLNAPENASVIAQPVIEGQLVRLRSAAATTSPSSRRSTRPPPPARAKASSGTSRIRPLRSRQGPTVRHIDDRRRVNYWHSSAFTWDGQYVVYMDESFTGRCASRAATARSGSTA